ncbi:MAG TPA: protease pro-enzyme activation domain-containing protein [Dehalococcoidia bacterium]|nr:protease pro-enzyme activation domain-containing protein [Dehalococcoidia bacterium]
MRLPGHTLAALAQAQALARQPAAAGQPITLTLGLTRTNQAGFDAFLADVQNPQSPQYRHFLSQQQLADRFGPSPAAVAAVRAFMEAQGFRLVQDSANRLTLTFQGTRQQAEAAFAVTIGDFQLGGRGFFANTGDPAVPSTVAPFIGAVAGLNNLARPHRAGPAQRFAPGVVGGLPTPMDLASFYNATGIGSGTGAGQKLGLVEFSTYSRSDVSAWLQAVGLPTALLNDVSDVAVNGGTTDTSGTIEDLLDIDTALGIAQGATIVDYQAPNGGTTWQQLFNAMLNDGDTVISNSWFTCEADHTAADVQNLDSIFANAAASGVSIYSATGDSEGTCYGGPQGQTAYPNSISVPADLPNGIAVGGTNITLGQNGGYGSERLWSEVPGAGSGAGFGTSQFFSRPSFQNGFTAAAMRSVPDVAAAAYPGILVCQAGCNWQVYGTSLAAPVWAASTALINQQQGGGFGGPQVLYSANGSAAYHTPASMGSDFPHLGLGTPNLGNFFASFAPGLQAPVEGSTGVSVTPTLQWAAPTGAVSGTTQYTAYIWDPNAGAMKFQQTTTALSITVPSNAALANNTFYYYSARACTGTRCSGYARWEGFTTAPLGTPGLTSPQEGATGVSVTPTVSWTAANGAVSGTTQYTAYIWDPAANAMAWQASTTGLSVSVPQGSALANGHFYYYSAQACTGSTCGPLARWEGFTTIGTPGAPGLTAPAEGATNVSRTPTVQWTAPNGALSGTTQYTAYIWDPSANAMAWQGTTTQLSIAVPGGSPLAAGHFFYYTVQACNGSLCGPNARWEGFTTQSSLGTPGLQAPVEGSRGNGVTPTLRWSAASGATGSTTYTASVWDPSASVMKFQQTVSGLSVAVPASAGLVAGHFYYYSVQACTGSDCGPLARWEGFTS